MGPGCQSQMAPSLYSALRAVLQKQQMSHTALENYMSSLKSLDRYNKPFQLIWALLEQKNIQPPKASISEVVSAIIELSEISIPQARNAYSALIYFPQFQALKFNSQLQPLKRKWNVNTQKYGAFWQAEDVIAEMACSQLIPEDLVGVRSRLILCFRLFGLFRGVDLARTLRKISFVGDKAYIMVKRKGWQTYKWEQVISLPQAPAVSPFHLLKQYVALTAQHGTPGGPLLLSLSAPFRPLSANTINSLTKSLLLQHGIPMGVYGAHSTRGAGWLIIRDWAYLLSNCVKLASGKMSRLLLPII